MAGGCVLLFVLVGFSVIACKWLPQRSMLNGQSACHSAWGENDQIIGSCVRQFDVAEPFTSSSALKLRSSKRMKG